MIVFADAADKATVTVCDPACSVIEKISLLLPSLNSIVGAASSSVIVNVAVESLIDAFVGLDKVIVAVSLFSSVVSARTGTLNVPEVAPAEIVNVPDVAV